MLVRFLWLRHICWNHSTDFLSGNLDSESAASGLLQLDLKFARQVLNKELDTIGDDDVQQTAFTLVKAMKKLVLLCFVDVWKMPAGFPIMDLFPMDIL